MRKNFSPSNHFWHVFCNLLPEARCAGMFFSAQAKPLCRFHQRPRITKPVCRAGWQEAVSTGILSVMGRSRKRIRAPGGRVMLRIILAVFGGVIAGGVATALLEALGYVAFPLPEGLFPTDLSDGDAVRAALAAVPDINRLAVVAAWGGGALVAGFVTTLLARSSHQALAMLAGGGLLFAGLSNLIYTPSPLWMWALGLAVFLPMAWLGYRLAPKRS
jgi:hypothetical protein